jgi:hypothetical protein
MSDVTFPITLNRQDGSEILNGDLTAVGGLPVADLGSLDYLLVVAVNYGPYANGGSLSVAGAAVQDQGPYSQAVQVAASLPATTYSGATSVVTVNGWYISNIPDLGADYDLVLNVVVASEDGTEVIRLAGTATVPAGTDSGTVLAADLTATAEAGTDLTYNASGGVVTTTAGGIFGVLINASGTWA